MSGFFRTFAPDFEIANRKIRGRRIYILLLLSVMALSVMAHQRRIYGYVVDTRNVGIELANVYLKTGQRSKVEGQREAVEGQNGQILCGTTTNRNGYYDLLYEADDSVTIVFSMVGYETLEQRLFPKQDVLNINVELPTDAEALAEVEVRGIRRQLDQMDRIDALTTRVMPNVSGSIESLLITFTGVTQNNELSSQYNVRGGSFDENSVYVNGIEVHRPLLIRAGQQEGLSFVNPDMTQTVEFSAGGFEARYADKMASVLDITYKRPQRFESSVSASLLGLSGYVGFGNDKFTQMHGIRYKTSRYFLSMLPTKATYNPDFVDYQTQMTWKVGQERPHGPWEISFLGNVSRNQYIFIPSSEAISYGTFQNPVVMNKDLEGQEKDLFLTAFGALSAAGDVTKEVRLSFTASGYYTNERETYDITTDYILSEKDMSETTETGATKEKDISEDRSASILGRGTYHDHARNSLEAGVVTVQHDGMWKRGMNRLRWGASLRGELIRDHISEWEWRDSAGYSLPTREDAMELFYAMRGETSMQSLRAQAYLQDTYTWATEQGDVLLTGGVRFHYWTFNREPLFSPRASVTWIPGWKRDLTLRLATGLYYQAPFYKELRNTLTYETGMTRLTLNSDIRAQRSVHVILGSDYYFRAWGRPFKFTAEAYYKYMDRLVTYSVDNVRVRYSGKNDAEGYAAGIDLKLYGELVPGADSWISFSAMSSKERLLDRPDLGWRSRPNEQRYNFVMFFQDYFPRWPQYVFHLKFTFSDGLPFGYPRNIETRNTMRSPAFKRIDLGVSRVFRYGQEKWMRNRHVDSWWIQFEVLNVVGWKNVNSYSWLTDYNNQAWAVPNYLTGRMFNAKIIVDFR